MVFFGVSLKNREAEVERKLDEFRQSRLVITDRLHGMVFAAITGTPCIAFNNSSGKVEGVWRVWLRHLPYIKFVESADTASDSIDEMLSMGGQRFDQTPYAPYWSAIADILGSPAKTS